MHNLPQITVIRYREFVGYLLIPYSQHHLQEMCNKLLVKIAHVNSAGNISYTVYRICNFLEFINPEEIQLISFS